MSGVYVLTTSPLFSMSGPPFTIVGAFTTLEAAQSHAAWLDTSFEITPDIQWTHYDGELTWNTSRQSGAKRLWTIHQTGLDKVGVE